MPRGVTHSLVEALRAVPVFAGQDDDVLLDVVGASANLFWSAGSVVFEQGAPAEALYIVLSGRVRIVDAAGGEHRSVAELDVGNYFGEQGLLLRTTHSKRVEAVEDCELMVLPKEALQPLLAANPALAEHFRETLEARLRDNVTRAE